MAYITLYQVKQTLKRPEVGRRWPEDGRQRIRTSEIGSQTIKKTIEHRTLNVQHPTSNDASQLKAFSGVRDKSLSYIAIRSMGVGQGFSPEGLSIRDPVLCLL